MTKDEIKDIIKKYHLSYRKLATVLGISHGHLHDMLNGRKPLQRKYVIKIENIFRKD